jgi:D-alanine-D-alanine ligase-like ATP-grasp enzyme
LWNDQPIEVMQNQAKALAQAYLENEGLRQQINTLLSQKSTFADLVVSVEQYKDLIMGKGAGAAVGVVPTEAMASREEVKAEAPVAKEPLSQPTESQVEPAAQETAQVETAGKHETQQPPVVKPPAEPAVPQE